MANHLYVCIYIYLCTHVLTIFDNNHSKMVGYGLVWV